MYKYSTFPHQHLSSNIHLLANKRPTKILPQHCAGRDSKLSSAGLQCQPNVNASPRRSWSLCPQMDRLCQPKSQHTIWTTCPTIEEREGRDQARWLQGNMQDRQRQAGREEWLFRTWLSSKFQVSKSSSKSFRANAKLYLRKVALKR